VRSPSWIRRLPLVIAGIGVVAWLVLGRTSRARRPKEKPPAQRKPPFAGEAKIEGVRAMEGHRGWSGFVIDAHDGFAIAGARLKIERSAFPHANAAGASGNAGTVATAVAGEDGAFGLAPLDEQPGDRLVVEGPFHAALSQPLPPSGELAVALVLR